MTTYRDLCLLAEAIHVRALRSFSNYGGEELVSLRYEDVAIERSRLGADATMSKRYDSKVEEGISRVAFYGPTKGMSTEDQNRLRMMIKNREACCQAHPK